MPSKLKVTKSAASSAKPRKAKLDPDKIERVIKKHRQATESESESESQAVPQPEPKSPIKKVVDAVAKTLSFSDPSKLEGEVVIWKHELSLSELHRSQSINAPAGSVPLSVGQQNGKLMLWTGHIDPSPLLVPPLEPIDVIVAWTGDHGCKLPAGYRFLGTQQVGNLVYHVFVAAK